MEFNISCLSLQDLNSIEKDFKKNFDSFWNIELFKTELEKENTYYISAKQGEEIVGIAGIFLICDEVHLMNIITRKSKRRLGIASKLLEALIKKAITWSATCITLEVNEHNLPAISLYKKYNFSKVGIRKKYYNDTDNAIIMTLII